MATICEINPKSMLDVGVGFGKYDFLSRELLDLRPDKETGYASWSRRIDGIEIFDKYIYDNIFIGNALDILESLEYKYDCILAGDVLEHFTKEQGYKFIELCQMRAENVIICTPYIYYKQGEIFNNIYETHLSGWDISNFKALGASYLWIRHISLISVFTSKILKLPKAELLSGEVVSDADLIKIKELLEMYSATKQLKEALIVCERYYRFFSNDVELPMVAALCSEILGYKEKAYEWAERALAIDNSLEEERYR